tara:strand:- start:46 stop:264 length:219 start_codon:yes stop_codon:yes gene_type:complete
MSETKTPFEKAEYNIQKFTETAEMVHNLYEMKKLIEDSKNLTEEEQHGVNLIIDMAIKNLSQYMTKKGGKWN